MVKAYILLNLFVVTASGDRQRRHTRSFSGRLFCAFVMHVGFGAFIIGDLGLITNALIGCHYVLRWKVFKCLFPFILIFTADHLQFTVNGP